MYLIQPIDKAIFEALSICSIVSWLLETLRREEPYLFNPQIQNSQYCLISYRAGAWHYRIFPDFLKSPVSKWRIVGVKTRTKAIFFEEILINIPLDNLSKLRKERTQYFCHALKLNLRSRHAASASNFSMNRSLEPNMIINSLQQRTLCLILPAYEK